MAYLSQAASDVAACGEPFENGSSECKAEGGETGMNRRLTHDSSRKTDLERPRDC
jgi:hypothetical protein